MLLENPVQKVYTALSILVLAGALAPAGLLAAEETVVLDNGVALKVLFFRPHETAEPPLAVLVSGGSNSEFMARAQFWLGREMVERGWAIAVPISPADHDYFVQSPELIPEIIGYLHSNHSLRSGKSLLVGISSGGSAALAIAIQQPQRYLGVVATPGRVREEARISGLGGLPIYLRIGEKDSFRWHRKLEQTVQRLHAGGANVDAALVPDARHIFPLDWEELGAWLERVQQPR